MRRAKAIGAASLFSVWAAAVVTGCVSQDNARTLELAVGTRCTLNSDCTSPNVCTFGVCHAECNSSADCADGERCVKGDKGTQNVCQLASESKCATASDCAGEQVCGVDGECRDGCKTAGECLKGQVCTQGTCADASEVDPSGGKLPEDPAHVGEGQPCIYNTDCPDPLACVKSTCAYECNGDKDCSPGDTCTDHRCTAPVTPPPKTVECNFNKDCDIGTLCMQNKCVPGCTTDSGCADGSRCLSGQCAAPVLAAPPRAMAIDGSTLLAVYSQELLSCPVAGCDVSNITQLAPLPAQNYDTYTVGADGGLIGATVTQSFSGSTLYCTSPACDNKVFIGDSPVYAQAFHGYKGQPYFYRAYGFGEGGFGVDRCQYIDGQFGCQNEVSFDFDQSNFDVVTSLAVERAATPDQDTLFAAVSNGAITYYDVNQCISTGNCAPQTLTHVVDAIGGTVEAENLTLVGTELYWTTLDGSGSSLKYDIQRCSITGLAGSCMPETIYSHHAEYDPLMTADAQHLYVSDDGNVWSIPIPP